MTRDAAGYPVLETERLIMRVPQAADFPAWSAFMQDEEAARFIGGTQPPPVAWRGMATMAGSWSLIGFGMFSVIEKSTGEWIGRVGPWRPEGWPGPEVGWGIVRSRWGQGFAFEAACAAMDFAVDELGWTDIIHTIEHANLASQKLAAGLGSQQRGTCRMPPPFQAIESQLWGQSADAWRARRAGLDRRG